MIANIFETSDPALVFKHFLLKFGKPLIKEVIYQTEEENSGI